MTALFSGSRTRLGGSASGGALGSAQIVSDSGPAVAASRDSLKIFADRNPVALGGEAQKLAQEFHDFTKKFDDQIRHALRVAFLCDLRTVKGVAAFERTMAKPDASVPELVAAREQASALTVCSRAYFEANIKAKPVTLNQDSKYALDFLSPEDKQRVFALHDRLRESFNERKDELAVGLETRIRAGYSRMDKDFRVGQLEHLGMPSATEPTPEELVGGKVIEAPAAPPAAPVAAKVPGPEVVQVPAVSVAAPLPTAPLPTASTRNLTSLAASVKPDATLVEAMRRAEAISIGGKTSSAMNPKASAEDLKSFQTLYTNHTARWPVASPSWGIGEEGLRQTMIGTARRVFGDTVQSSQLMLPRGLCVLRDAGSVSDSRSSMAKLWAKRPGADMALPENYRTLTITIVPPKDIDKVSTLDPRTGKPLYARTPDQLFMVNLAVVIPEEQMKSVLQVLRDPACARGAMLGLFGQTGAASKELSPALALVRDCILLPLVRHVHSLPDSTTWSSVTLEQRKAVMGMFDIMNAGAADFVAKLERAFAQER